MEIHHDDADVVVVGGGIAGLWLAAELRRRGLDVLLAEAGSLGGGQTRFAQGIIHGGLKFSLTGKVSAAARATATMPDRWRASLRALATPDLSAVTTLSPAHYVVGSASIVSGITKMVAARVTAARATRLAGQARPAVFAAVGVAGSIVELDEPVIDVHSTIVELSRVCRPAIVQAQAFVQPHPRPRPVVRLAMTDGRRVEVAAKVVVWTAGAGNEAVHARTQRRPLHMVILRRRRLPKLFVHCTAATARPRLTVTSHTHDGFDIWYLGGELAESGVAQDRQQLLAHARVEVAALFPKADLKGAQWTTVRVDRAEPLCAGRRPDDCVCEIADDQIIAWPTKLALAPRLAERVVTWVLSRLTPGSGPRDRVRLAYPCADVAPPPWVGDLEWS